MLRRLDVGSRQRTAPKMSQVRGRMEAVGWRDGQQMRRVTYSPSGMGVGLACLLGSVGRGADGVKMARCMM